MWDECEETALMMSFIFVSFVFALYSLVVMFVLWYKKTWKTLIRLPLNTLIDVFYQRITANKYRPGMLLHCKWQLSEELRQDYSPFHCSVLTRVSKHESPAIIPPSRFAIRLAIARDNCEGSNLN